MNVRTLVMGLAFSSALAFTAQAQSDEAVFWQSISNSSDGAEFCAYLEAFPSGQFAPLAKLRARKLGADCSGGPAAPAPSASAPTPQPSQAQAQLPKQGRLKTVSDMRDSLNMGADGVTLKWSGEYCTRLLGDKTSRSVPGGDGPATANELYDSNDSRGIWGIRRRGENADLCLQFASWNHWQCYAMDVTGRAFNTSPAPGTPGTGYKGVILPAGDYDSCAGKRYKDVLAAAKAEFTQATSMTPMNQYLWVLEAANVRSEPSTSGAKIGLLNMGDIADVRGKFTDKNWYKIKMEDGRTGYVFGTLIGNDRPNPPSGTAPQTATTQKPAPKPAPGSTQVKAPSKNDGWTTFNLKMDMFPDAVWTGTSGGCAVKLEFEPFEGDPKYTWTQICLGKEDTETDVYGLSPGLPWLNLPTTAGLLDLCRLQGNDDGHIRIHGCKYEGIYSNSDRAPMIIAAVKQYRADAPKREAERIKRDAENKKRAEEERKKAEALAKTPYGRQLNALKSKSFGEAPVPASGQGIVVCTKHSRTARGSSGLFPEGHVLNFNASREAEMKAELETFGVPDFTLAKAPWSDRDSYTLFDVFDGIIFYDRNIERRRHPTGDGTYVIGEMRNARINDFIEEAGPDVRCEVMLARKTCADPKDTRGNFSMPCD